MKAVGIMNFVQIVATYESLSKRKRGDFEAGYNKMIIDM